MVKILSIGNSFSQDAQRYLNKIAVANGEEIKNVNLMIGGCPLHKHYVNASDDRRAYNYEYKGEATGITVSIKDALISDEWDYITLQQASPKSFDFSSYNPYLERLCDYIDKYSPNSKILLHQTWAYPDESAQNRGFADSGEMFKMVKLSYEKAYELIKPHDMILSGEAMNRAYKENRDIVYRDAIHASLGFGRYMLGIVWFKTLFGINDNFKHISEFDVDVTESNKDLAMKIAFNK